MIAAIIIAAARRFLFNITTFRGQSGIVRSHGPAIRQSLATLVTQLCVGDGSRQIVGSMVLTGVRKPGVHTRSGVAAGGLARPNVAVGLQASLSAALARFCRHRNSSCQFSIFDIAHISRQASTNFLNYINWLRRWIKVSIHARIAISIHHLDPKDPAPAWIGSEISLPTCPGSPCKKRTSLPLKAMAAPE